MIRATALASAAVLVLTLAGPAAAETYRWVDDRGVVHYTQGLDSVPERYRETTAVLPLREAPPVIAAPALGTTGHTTIAFVPGQRIVAGARINGTIGVRLLLDTGADRTVLSPRAVAAAGISLTRGAGIGTMKGATGTARIRVVPVESIEIGDARVGRLIVIAHDIDQSDVDGLLGRDFLEQFTVTIDNARGLVTLAPKTPSR